MDDNGFGCGDYFDIVSGCFEVEDVFNFQLDVFFIAFNKDSISTNTGISWYRGYFKDNLQQKDVDRNLKAFHAKAIAVGHTLQLQGNRQFKGKVIGVDVKHPKDYSKSFPDKKSEGLLIEGKRFYRVLHTGKIEEI